MNTTIYWIRHKDHTDMFNEGYIGVSNSPEKRWIEHFKYNGNMHLSNAIKLYGWKNLIKEIILVSNREYCFNIEIQLRPTEQIGWNIAKGGKRPPISKTRGEDYISPLKGKPRKTPWLVNRNVKDSTKKLISDRQKVKVKYKNVTYDSFTDLAKTLGLKLPTLANRIYRNPQKWGYEVLK